MDDPRHEVGVHRADEVEQPRPEQQDSVNFRFVAQRLLAVAGVDVDGFVGGGDVGGRVVARIDLRFFNGLDQILRLMQR